MTISEIQEYLASLPPTPNIYIIDYQDVPVVTNKELEHQKRLDDIVETINNIKAERKLAEENRAFNHFLETGEIIKPKSEDLFTIDSIASITSLVRPGKMSNTLNQPTKLKPKRKKNENRKK